MDSRPLITLLTDFGTDDTYVGQMKGVIAGICPDAAVIDLTHSVRPQAIEQGAFLLETAIDAFPHSTVHVAVVDPGVGTDRLGIAVREAGCFFVGPDNGVLSAALANEQRPAAAGRVPLGDSVAAVALPLPEGGAVAPTFHGRDIFAVVAARLALGEPLDTLGRQIGEMIALPPFRAIEREADVLEGRVVHIDRFGNIITTVHVSQLRAKPRAVRLGERNVTEFVRTYGERQGVVALVGSSGFLEVAEVNGSAAARLGCDLGAAVTVLLEHGA